MLFLSVLFVLLSISQSAREKLHELDMDKASTDGSGGNKLVSRYYSGEDGYTGLDKEDEAKVMKDEKKVEGAEKKAMRRLEEERNKCNGNDDCVAKVDKEEQELIEESTKRELAVKDVLKPRIPAVFEGVIKLDFPKGDSRRQCRFRDVNDLLRKNFPTLSRVMKIQMYNVHRWVHDLNRVVGNIRDYESSVEVLEDVLDSVKEIYKISAEPSNVPRVGRVVERMRRRSIKPILGVLELHVPPLRKMKVKLRQGRFRLMRLRDKLADADRDLKRVKLMADDAPAGLAVLKSVVKEQECRGKEKVESRSRRMNVVVRLAIKLFREMRHLHFYPRQIGRYSLNHVLAAVIQKPVGRAHRVVQRFNRALDLRLPLVLPEKKYEKKHLPFPLNRDVSVPYPDVKRRYLSPRKALQTLDTFGSLKGAVEDLMMKPMKPLMAMIDGAINRPFRVMGQMFLAEVSKLGKFGGKVVKFIRKADRVRAILDELKLRDLVKKLKVPKPPSQSVRSTRRRRRRSAAKRARKKRATERPKKQVQRHVRRVARKARQTTRPRKVKRVFRGW